MKTVRADTDQYRIEDLDIGEITLSVTMLNPGKSTNGHTHDWGEAYYVASGAGVMELDGDKLGISTGDFIQIRAGEFHRVSNPSQSSILTLVCAWKNQG